LNHSSQKVYADKSLSFQIDIWFVSVGEKERTASKRKFVNDQVLNVYIVVNRIGDTIHGEWFTNNQTSIAKFLRGRFGCFGEVIARDSWGETG
jgi:hypothetical protein